MLMRVEGIVIRATDYGEGNRILNVLTAQSGKISMMARGAKKVKSRFSALSQPFTYAEFVIFRSSAQAMGTVNAGEIIRSHHRLREDLLLSAYAAYMAELTSRIVGDGEPVPGLFEQLLAAYEGLEAGKDAVIITQIYEMMMLAVAGFMPELHACVRCARTEEPLVGLSAANGGTLCQTCRVGDPSAIPATPAVLKLLRIFQQMDLRRLGDINISPETKDQLQQFIRAYIDYHLHVRWKSRDLLDQLSSLGFDE